MPIFTKNISPVILSKLQSTEVHVITKSVSHKWVKMDARRTSSKDTCTKPNKKFCYHELIPNQTKYMMGILTDCIIRGNYYVSCFMVMTVIQTVPENVHKRLPNSTMYDVSSF